jgi:hypothetical protein
MESRFGRSFDLVQVSAGDESRAALEGVGADGVTRGPEGSKHKSAGILAAIPIVEIVIARARSLSQRKAPAYSEDAGRGLGIASYHGYREASSFLRAAGELNYCNVYFGIVAGDWEERRQALLAVKDRIGGPRPGQPE